MRTTLFLCLVVSLLTARSPAMAANASSGFNGRELLSMCQSSYDTDYGYCAGYVTAIAHNLLTQPVSGYAACGHAPVKSQQLIDIYQSYAEIFPEMMKEEASTAAAAAIARAFPCIR